MPSPMPLDNEVPDTLSESPTASQQLVESEERYRSLVESLDVGFCVIQMLFDENGHCFDYLFVEANPAFERHTGLVNIIGKKVREFIPNHDEIWFEAYGGVALTGIPVRLEDHAVAMNRWFEVYAQRVGNPDERKVGVFFTDVSERKVAEQALQESEERLREQAEYLRRVVGSSPDCIKTLDMDGNILSMNEGGQRLLEIDDFEDVCGMDWLNVWQDSATKDAVNAALDAARSGGMGRFQGFSPTFKGTPKWWDVVVVPLLGADGKPEQLLGLSRDVTEQHEAQTERENLLAEARASAEREALINQIGSAVRTATRPADVLAVAVEALGKALKADRCYYATYDQKIDSGSIGPDWRREGIGLVSISGRYKLSNYTVNSDQGYMAGRTQVVDDVHEHAARIRPASADAPSISLMDELGLRSIIRTPLLLDGSMTGLAVAMSGGPRSWTANEVGLVEAIAAQTRAAVEAARAQERERKIAETLQDALLPAAPPLLPGLSLAHFYRPALDEAGVGGDFYDVFDIHEGCTALVVADLSGKGLAAASQTALVRNMLRFVLYNCVSVAEAIRSLHQTLVTNDLLTGFATLFVGLFDHADRTFTYVNCGQEPALIYRAFSGEIERLGPTGPVLGGFASDGFEQALVALADGDILAIFTDGLTEAGPSRKNLLEVDGVCDLLAECCTEAEAATAESVKQRLIERVSSFARGGIADDIALLVGIVGTPR